MSYGLGERRIRLSFHSRDSLSLLLESGGLVLDLLPPGGSVTNGALRAHLVTLLKELAAQGFPRGFERATESSARAAQGTPWATLGLVPGASAREVQQAYRSLAKIYHPDRVAPGSGARVVEEAEKKMKALNQAYRDLSRKP